MWRDGEGKRPGAAGMTRFRTYLKLARNTCPQNGHPGRNPGP